METTKVMETTLEERTEAATLEQMEFINTLSKKFDLPTAQTLLAIVVSLAIAAKKNIKPGSQKEFRKVCNEILEKYSK